LGQPGTWITPDMRAAYLRLHEDGLAHSVEVWEGARLVGGIYGLAFGSAVFGESMYSEVPDASKLALVALCTRMARHGYTLLDCQVQNAHLESMGAVDMSRARFLGLLGHCIAASRPRFVDLFQSGDSLLG
ncbi:MAG: leucyl/phenylalanyl-tRNA--protein transferase, partial [Xanthomonadales bacterium]|nr:leucyl/phenylalanyl-tRNA--protein transferase [Xanthomonadales bacterium]